MPLNSILNPVLTNEEKIQLKINEKKRIQNELINSSTDRVENYFSKNSEQTNNVNKSVKWQNIDDINNLAEKNDTFMENQNSNEIPKIIPKSKSIHKKKHEWVNIPKLRMKAEQGINNEILNLEKPKKISVNKIRSLSKSVIFKEDIANQSLIESIRNKNDKIKNSSSSLNSPNFNIDTNKPNNENYNIKDELENLFKLNRYISYFSKENSNDFIKPDFDYTKTIEEFLNNAEENNDQQVFKKVLNLYLKCPKDQMESYFEALHVSSRASWIASMCNQMQRQIITIFNFIKSYMRDFMEFSVENKKDSHFKANVVTLNTMGSSLEKKIGITRLDSIGFNSQINSRNASYIAENTQNQENSRLKNRNVSLENIGLNLEFTKKEAISTSRVNKRTKPLKMFTNSDYKTQNNAILTSINQRKTAFQKNKSVDQNSSVFLVSEKCSNKNNEIVEDMWTKFSKIKAINNEAKTTTLSKCQTPNTSCTKIKSKRNLTHISFLPSTNSKNRMNLNNIVKTHQKKVNSNSMTANNFYEDYSKKYESSRPKYDKKLN